MKIYDNKILSDALLVQNLRIAARIYARYVDQDVLIVYAQSKQGPFQTYEFHAGKRNFQHLAGVKFPNGAESFFDRCLNNEHVLTRKEIVPKENIKVTSAKIAVLGNAVDLTKSKAYKFGEKDLITLHNNFDMAIGNTQAIIIRRKFIPVTSITSYGDSCV